MTAHQIKLVLDVEIQSGWKTAKSLDVEDEKFRQRALTKEARNFNDQLNTIVGQRMVYARFSTDCCALTHELTSRVRDPYRTMIQVSRELD